MHLESGTRLGPYEVIAPLGAGGMGEVWKARDTRLERSVAIKVLPAAVAQNAQLKLRFEREAKTISQLNHPNICTLYDVGDDYLVMELLEGETLADRVARGPLPISETLRIGAQIAEALDRAHRAGIVHRDLKPGNVMLTKTGAKLLDFGLAKSGAFEITNDGATLQKSLTAEGTILGTFQYMAPEQLEGVEADPRTDIFALGAVLYEMASGRRAFDGKTKTSLIAAIVGSDPPPIAQLQPMTPPALEHVIRKCLSKEPDDRWQSAHDIAEELRWISEAGSQVDVPASRRRTTAWLVPIVAALLAAAFTWTLLEWRKPVAGVIETSILPPDGWQFDFNGATMAVSPSGGSVAFVAQDGKGNTALFVRALDSAVPRQLGGTDGARYPFWSPDGRQVAFFATTKLKVIDLSTGTARILADAPTGRGGSWSAAGKIVFTPTVYGGIFAIPADGGTASPVTRLRPREGGHRFPSFLGDGVHFIYFAAGPDPGIFVGSTTGEEQKLLMRNDSVVYYASPGCLLVWRDGAAVVQRFDEKTFRLIGAGEGVAQTVARAGLRPLVASGGAVMAYVAGSPNRTQLVWVDRTGKEIGSLAPPGYFFSPRLSHDGSRLAVDISDANSGVGNIWVFDVRRQAAAPARLTFGSVNESGPVWSIDDREITFFSGTGGRVADLYRIDSSGTGEARPLVQNDANKMAVDVSRDGQWLLFVADALHGSGGDLWLYSEREQKAKAWLATPFNESSPAMSPNGKWIAYQSNESGRLEVYVRSFPDGREKWLVSNGGGGMPAWSADGREIYYVAPPSMMMAVQITSGTSFTAGTPVPLFEARVLNHPTSRQYEVTADGTRFLLNRRDTDKQQPVTVVQNWRARLSR
jgi:Tol biopolymer transport system component/predicted Ser/Thr protein kinase